MGYTLELFATDVDALVAELRAPTLDVRALVDPTGLVDRLRPQWGELATTVAGALAQGGGELGGELALYVQAVVRARGHWYGALWHTSSGGEAFRRTVLPGPVAARFGRELVVSLVNRALGGLTWADYPVLGYAMVDELRRALSQLDASPDDDVDADVQTLELAAGRAAVFGLDLVSVYG